MVAVWTVMCLWFVGDKMFLVQVQRKQMRVQTPKALTTVAMQACRRLSQSSWYDMACNSMPASCHSPQERFVACCQLVP